LLGVKRVKFVKVSRLVRRKYRAKRRSFEDSTGPRRASILHKGRPSQWSDSADLAAVFESRLAFWAFVGSAIEETVAWIQGG
jgi:hypothetical protein